MSETIAESSPRDGIFSQTEARLIRKATLGLLPILTIAFVIAFIGPSLMGWLKATIGAFTSGLAVLAALIAVSAVLSMALARQLPLG